MSEDKFYRIQTKKGAHINEKLNDDGSRAAIQFDKDNNLKGPVNLIEVDKTDYPTRKNSILMTRKAQSFPQTQPLPVK